MNRSFFSRRKFLAASGLSAAMLPLMPGFGRAQAAGPIRRFIAIGVPNGHTDKWLPQGGENDWTINGDADSPLKPLERHKSSVNVLGGLWLKNAWDTTYVVANHDPRNFAPGFKVQLMNKDLRHKIEKVGVKLRDRMPWLQEARA